MGPCARGYSVLRVHHDHPGTAHGHEPSTCRSGSGAGDLEACGLHPHGPAGGEDGACGRSRGAYLFDGESERVSKFHRFPMKRRFTPQEKKQNRYDLNHVTLGWKTGIKYRKKLRQKKVLAERSVRRKLSLVAHGLLRDEEGDAPVSAKPRRLDAGPPPTVRELLETKARRRAGSHGAKAARRARSIDLSARAIEDILKQVVRRRKVDDLERLRDLRAFVRSETRFVSGRQLAEFLRRHPAWMTRLRAWRHDLWSRVGIGPRRPER